MQFGALVQVLFLGGAGAGAVRRVVTAGAFLRE